MFRTAIQSLKEWKNRLNRKPLVIRGARQVGKSYLVQDFGKSEFKNILEVNLEIYRDVITFFDNPDIKRGVDLLAVQFNCNVVPGETLLFFDEIQAVPELLAKLRYFYEQMPDLHVIAAGSLLEFVIKEHSFSMPVGRIEFLHLGPMSFTEFLIATENRILEEELQRYTYKREWPLPIHLKCLDLLRRYLIIGGMPECINVFVNGGSYSEIDRIKHGIIATYRDDFAKYSRKNRHAVVQDVFNALPKLPGTIIKYTQISKTYRPEQVSEVLHLLSLAKICYLVNHSSCNGLPLGAEINSKKFKLLFLDVGLMSSGCGLSIVDLEKASDLILVNNGSITEQFIGQHLLYRKESYIEPELYFWSREKYPSNAEIDYVIESGTTLVGVEVKSGSGGSLRSLNQFIIEKKQPFAVRFNSDVPSVCQSKGMMPNGDPYDFTLLSLPVYMVGYVDMVIKNMLQR